MAMTKAHENQNWENFPSMETPVNEQNLNKLDRSVDELDNRIIVHEEVKATKEEVAPLIKDVQFNEKTGVFTFTKKDGSSFKIDTLLETILTNWEYDEVNQRLILTMEDGNKQYVDLSALITQYEFLESETITFVVGEDGKVSAKVRDGSIQEKHLQPNYLAEIKVEAAKAEAARTAAQTSEKNAKDSETASANSAKESASSASSASASATNAKGSETSAASSAATATTKASEAATSASSASTSATTATQKADAASTSATNASTSATNATTQATNASKSATAAEASAKKAQSYAEGDTGLRPSETTDNAKYYYQQSKAIYDKFESAGDVTGVKGSAETNFRHGNVSLSAENVGAFEKIEWKNPIKVNSWSPVARLEGIHAGILTVGLSQNSQTLTYTYSVSTGYNSAYLAQIGSTGFKLNSGIGVRIVSGNPFDCMIEIYNPYGYQGIENTECRLVYVELGDYTTSIEKYETTTEHGPSYSNVRAEINPSYFDGIVSKKFYGALIGNADTATTATTANKTKAALTFTGAADGTVFDGSTAKSVNIPSIPKSLPANGGNAETATSDGKGNNIEDTYAKRIIYEDSCISFGRKGAKGNGSIAFGSDAGATGSYSSAIGYNCVANTNYCHSVGYNTISSNFAATALGKNNKYMTVGGTFNNQLGDAFILGNGTGNPVNGVTQSSNAFRVTYTGEVYGKGSFNTSGADYAEFIKEWADGNPDSEDRVGYFVTIKEGLLHKANEGDYIAGITSGNPSVVGNSDEDYYWRYERDEFNRIVMEDVPELEEVTDEEGNVVIDEETGAPLMVETGKIIPKGRMKQSADYDPSKMDVYVERKDRSEWDYVGMIGVLPVRDDGTCVPDHFCRCGGGGIATYAEEQGFDTFYVIERINDHAVSVLLR